uniref:Putative secreted peptide n=1 Tax=Anopheles braziliensis TaxID=58242 RepID=A0A2M3ZQN6_9DIPT
MYVLLFLTICSSIFQVVISNLLLVCLLLLDPKVVCFVQDVYDFPVFEDNSVSFGCCFRCSLCFCCSFSRVIVLIFVCWWCG